MRLLYISVNTYPSERANFVQISDFVSTLSRLTSMRFVVPLDQNLMTEDEVARLAEAQVIAVSRYKLGKYASIFLALLKNGLWADRIYTRSPRIALIAACTTRCPVTVELHETPPLRMQTALLRHPRIHIVTISKMQHDVLAEQGASHLSYVPLSTSGWNIPQDTKVRYDVAYAGSSAPGKGVERLIEAARIRPDLRFLLICKMTSEVAADLPTNIKVTGFLSHDEVGPMLAQARLLVAPYERRIYGADGEVDISGTMSPLKIFEYMNIGRPIVSADIPAVRMLLGDLGHYFEPGSTAGLLGAVDAGLEFPENVGQKLYGLWKRCYSTEARAKRLLEIWQTPSF